MAWIIRDNQHLLGALDPLAQCSNGTLLSELQLPDGYADCPPKENQGKMSNEVMLETEFFNRCVPIHNLEYIYHYKTIMLSLKRGN